MTTFGIVPIGAQFSARLWGDGKHYHFVKRDAKTATDLAVFKKHGHIKRSWHGRTQFRMRDPVILSRYCFAATFKQMFGFSIDEVVKEP